MQFRVIKNKDESVKTDDLHQDFYDAEERILHAVRKHCGEYQDVICTSGKDGTHSEKSAHYTGNAIDLRIRNLQFLEGNIFFKENLHALCYYISRLLGRKFWVIQEGTHIHIQNTPENIKNPQSFQCHVGEVTI